MSLSVLLVLIMPLIPAPAGKAPSASELDGRWRLVAYDYDGRHVGPDGLSETYLTFAGGRGTLAIDGKKAGDSRYLLNTAVRPKTLDCISAEGKTVCRAIYELRDDTFTLCSAPPGKARPTRFSAKHGEEALLLTYRRTK